MQNFYLVKMFSTSNYPLSTVGSNSKGCPSYSNDLTANAAFFYPFTCSSIFLALTHWIYYYDIPYNFLWRQVPIGDCDKLFHKIGMSMSVKLCWMIVADSSEYAHTRWKSATADRSGYLYVRMPPVLVESRPAVWRKRERAPFQIVLLYCTVRPWTN